LVLQECGWRKNVKERGKNMRGGTRMKRHRWWLVLFVLSLSLLGSLSLPALTNAQTAGAVCAIRVFGNGELMAVFTTPPTNFAVTVLVPPDKDVLVPVLCDDLGVIGAGVTNQEKNKEVAFRVRVFDNNGIWFCEKGPFALPVRGSRGLTFADCPEP
jgi:hypothetical protein